MPGLAAVGPYVRPHSSRSTQLDVLPGFFEEEDHLEEKDHLGSITIAALVAETLVGGQLGYMAGAQQEDVAGARQEDVAGARQEEEGIVVAQASLPPPVESSSEGRGPASKSIPKSFRARFVALAFAVVAVGFGIGCLLTRPAPAAPGGSHSSPATAAAPSVIDGATIVSVPTVSIRADVASAAPIESGQPSASKPPPTLADGDWMLKNGQVPRAEAIYRSVLASGGSEHAALTGLGKVALANHRPSEALAFFERALARQPQYFPARLGRADALWDAGRRDSAKAHYAALRERYPDAPPRVIERTR